MEELKVMDRYAYYHKAIQAVGSVKIDQEPTAYLLNISKGIFLRGYRDIKEEEFKGTLIDWLCYISTVYLVVTFRKFDPKMGVVDFSKEIIRRQAQFKVDVQNMLRLFKKDPSRLLGMFPFQELRDVFEAYQILSNYWFLQFWFKRSSDDKILDIQNEFVANL